MMPRTPTTIEKVSWSELRQHLRSKWKPGEHFSIIAPTGGGKTTIAVRGLLPLWRWAMVLDAKGDDPSLASFGKKVPRYPTGLLHRLDDTERYRIVPPVNAMSEVFGEALGRVWSDKGWTIYIDELRLFSDPKYFGLASHVERLWLFGRSRGITVIAGTQAPRWVPAAFYEQPRHFLIGYVRDARALKRVEEIGGDVDAIRQVVPNLGEFEFLYIGPKTMAVTKLPLGKPAKEKAR